jgi:hypothetical protein
MGNTNSSISPDKTYEYNKKKLYNELQTLNKTKIKIKLPHKNLNLKLTPEDVRQYKKSKDEIYKINQKIEKVQRELKYNSYKNKILPYSDETRILPQSDISNDANYTDGISRKKKYKTQKRKSSRRKTQKHKSTSRKTQKRKSTRRKTQKRKSTRRR